MAFRFGKGRVPPPVLTRGELAKLAILSGLAVLVLAFILGGGNWPVLARLFGVGDERAKPERSAPDTALSATTRPATTRPSATQPTRRTRDELFGPLRDTLLQNSKLRGVRTVDPAVLADVRDNTRQPPAKPYFHLLAVALNGSPGPVEQDATDRFKPDDLLSNPAQWRGRALRITGVVHRIEAFTAPDNDLGLTRLYQGWLHDPGTDAIYTFVVPQLPVGMQPGASMHEGATVAGLFLQVLAYGPDDAPQRAPLLMAGRIGWRPRVNTELLGFVRDRQTENPESAPYFHLLNVAQYKSHAELDDKAINPAPRYGDLYRQPQKFRGLVVRIHGRLRRLMEFPAPVNHYGFDRLYDGFVYDENGNGYLLGIAHVPDGMPRGSPIEEVVTVVGYFLKVQAYQAGDTWRAVPLVIVQRMRWLPTRPVVPRNDLPWLAVTVFGATALVVIIAAWVYARGDRRFRRRYQSRLAGPDDLPDLGSIDLGPSDGSPSADEPVPHDQPSPGPVSNDEQADDGPPRPSPSGT